MKDLTKDEFVFTPDNLLDNLHRVGYKSTYGLASIAIAHYYPEIGELEDPIFRINKEVAAIEKLGCKTWEDVITKYHTEVGYKGPFKTESVNEY